jgi:hypothetical protein
MKFDQESFTKKIELEQKRVKFDQESLTKKMNLEEKRDDFERTMKKRELEHEVEGFEDELDALVDGANPTRKRRLEERIEKLKTMITKLMEK